ncbi:hypothetical protein [Chryseobacterium paridis]|uniref:Outer membrane protein beta-barrel domain-containing protein n=1 Tax=Chryseobacterium paridis TaxID=2800328 RepID=A0ABS1G0G5_9FLAO|nr:hypothetical protein [Chryseobacterium paridis]MBK1897978.1 hypothetical protein [Chryseobacterium paridis]
MKKILFSLMMLYSCYAEAQVSIQGYTGVKETEVLGIFDKDFKTKWNYFALGNVSYGYESKKVNAEVYQNLNYHIVKNWGASAGVHISNEDVMPSVGLAFTKEKTDFGISLFPSLTYSFDSKEMGLGLYTLMEYTPKINDRFNFYSMLIIESDFSFKQHQSSNQVVRLGLETRKKVQFGIGSTISQTGSNFETSFDFGVFIGKKF